MRRLRPIPTPSPTPGGLEEPETLDLLLLASWKRESGEGWTKSSKETALLAAAETLEGSILAG